MTFYIFENNYIFGLHIIVYELLCGLQNIWKSLSLPGISLSRLSVERLDVLRVTRGEGCFVPWDITLQIGNHPEGGTGGTMGGTLATHLETSSTLPMAGWNWWNTPILDGVVDWLAEITGLVVPVETQGVGVLLVSVTV